MSVPTGIIDGSFAEAAIVRYVRTLHFTNLWPAFKVRLPLELQFRDFRGSL